MAPKEINPGAGKICVSIAGKDTAAALLAAKKAESGADVIEIRLDSLTSPDIEPFLRQLKTPLLFTNRPVWEGGLYDGPEENRLSPLMQAVQSSAAYVDIELQSNQSAVGKLCSAALNRPTRIIVSWHNFKETPAADALQDIFSRQHDSGAHIGKMVTMAHDFHDVLRVLQLQEIAHQKGFPLIAFCMGRAGMISRLATLELGGFMTYAAPDAGQGTAPGQLTVAGLVNCVQVFRHAD